MFWGLCVLLLLDFKNSVIEFTRVHKNMDWDWVLLSYMWSLLYSAFYFILRLCPHEQKLFFFHFHFDKHFRPHKNTKMKSSTCYVCGSIILCILKFWPIKKHKKNHSEESDFNKGNKVSLSTCKSEHFRKSSPWKFLSVSSSKHIGKNKCLPKYLCACCSRPYFHFHLFG